MGRILKFEAKAIHLYRSYYICNTGTSDTQTIEARIAEIKLAV